MRIVFSFLFIHQILNTGQRVKNKMRVKLRTDSLHFKFCEFVFQLKFLFSSRVSSSENELPEEKINLYWYTEETLRE